MTSIHLQISGEEQSITESQKPLRTLSAILSHHNYPINTRCGGRGLCNACQVHLLKGSTINIRSTHITHAPAIIKTCEQAPLENNEITIRIPERALFRKKPSVASDFKISIPYSLSPLAPSPTGKDKPWIGAAVDIGTTTTVLLLCDLRSGEILASDSAYNSQIRYGEDLITRIQLCSQDKRNISRLQTAITQETIQLLIEKACQKASIHSHDISSMVVAANTTMLHLLAGVDPTPIGTYPFTPTFLEHRIYTPAALGLSFGSSETQVHLLPSPAAYIGADISAGILASGMIYEEGAILLVDVGTNGEIILKNKGHLLGTATAAGPAFEGAGLTHGVRATEGAIDKIQISKESCSIIYETIGKSSPLGICGSAYIDFLAEARRAGYLTTHGRFTSVSESCRIAQTPESALALEITTRDISCLLQAKAAIAAGISILLQYEGIHASQIKTLYLAGGFGMHLNINNAIAIGLLPGFSPRQVSIIGNSSLAGALATLQDRSLLEELKSICSQIKSIELNLHPSFEDTFIDNLTLP